MEQSNLRIWPLLYFQADWPAESYKFDFDVRLIKAGEEILAIVGDVTSPAWGDNNKAMCDFSGNTEWFLSLPVPKPTEHVSASKTGILFEDQLQKAVKKSFLMCLRLIRQTNAICPLKMNNVELAGDSINPDSFRNALNDSHFFGENTDSPEVFMPQSFQLGDLQLLGDLWSAIIKLRNLDHFSTLIYKEEFFAACDKEAGEGAVKQIVDAIMSSPAYTELSEKEQRPHIEKWTASFKETLDKGGLEDFYRDSFEKVFLEKQEAAFSNRTRIGRALNLFYEGLGLPLLHSFLSMCLVLETLFTIGEGEISHRLATRTAKITDRNGTLDDRKDTYKRVKKVYAERSKIVHGEKLIDVVDPEVLRDAFGLARRSLQSILLSDQFLELYASPGTADRSRKVRRKKKKEKKTANEAIRELLLDLDLDGK